MLYSLTKGAEFFKKVSEFSGTPLARVFERAMAAKQGEQTYEDFAAYNAGDSAVSAFWAEPVYPAFVQDDTKPDAVLVLRLSAKTVDEILAGTEADGTKQDNFLVGPDGKLKSNRPSANAKAHDTGLPSSVVNKLTSGTTGYAEIDGTQGNPDQFAVYQSFTVGPTSYFLFAAQAEERALAAVTNMRNGMLLLSVGALVVFAGISIYLGTLLTKPINALAETVERLSQGDLKAAVPGLERKDELADIAKAVEIFKERAKENEQLHKQIEADRVDNDRRREEQDQLLGNAIGRVVASAAAGNFSERIETSMLVGVAATLGNGINSLLDGTGKSLTGINTFLDGMAHGDLTRRMDGDFKESLPRYRAMPIRQQSACRKWCARLPAPQAMSVKLLTRFRPALRIWLRVPSSRQPAWKRQLPRCTKSPPR